MSVKSITNTHEYAQARVMFRGGTNADAANSQLQVRSTENGDVPEPATHAASKASNWR